MTPMIPVKVTKKAALKFVGHMQACGWTVSQEKSIHGEYYSFRDKEGQLSANYEVIVATESFIRIRPEM